jgi:carboxymethylenebutenolidase
MGGSLTYATAAATPNLNAAVVFYGAPREPAGLENIRAPVLAFYGGQDHGIPLERVRELEKTLEQAGVTHEFHVYPQAGHAFFNDARPSHYDPAAAQDSWKRTLDWFEKYLKAG